MLPSNISYIVEDIIEYIEKYVSDNPVIKTQAYLLDNSDITIPSKNPSYNFIIKGRDQLSIRLLVHSLEDHEFVNLPLDLNQLDTLEDILEFFNVTSKLKKSKYDALTIKLSIDLKNKSLI